MTRGRPVGGAKATLAGLAQLFLEETARANRSFAHSQLALAASLGDETRSQELTRALGGRPADSDALLAVDGVFGEMTGRATRRFQGARRLPVDGVVGPATVQAAAALGFSADTEEPPRAPEAPRIEPARPPNDFYPAKPSYPPLRSDAERQRIFGKFAFSPAPTAANPQAITITDGWDHANIVAITVPGLAGIAYGWGRSFFGPRRWHALRSCEVVVIAMRRARDSKPDSSRVKS